MLLLIHTGRSLNSPIVISLVTLADSIRMVWSLNNSKPSFSQTSCCRPMICEPLSSIALTETLLLISRGIVCNSSMWLAMIRGLGGGE